MPIIVMGRGQDEGGSKFVDAFLGARDMKLREKRQMMAQQEMQQREARFQEQFQQARQRASHMQGIELRRAVVAEESLALDQRNQAQREQLQGRAIGQEDAQSRYLAAEGKIGAPTSGRSAEQMEGFLKLSESLGWLPSETIEVVRNMSAEVQGALQASGPDFQREILVREGQWQAVQKTQREAGDTADRILAFADDGLLDPAQAEEMAQLVRTGQAEQAEGYNMLQQGQAMQQRQAGTEARAAGTKIILDIAGDIADPDDVQGLIDRLRSNKITLEEARLDATLLAHGGAAARDLIARREAERNGVPGPGPQPAPGGPIDPSKMQEAYVQWGQAVATNPQAEEQILGYIKQLANGNPQLEIELIGGYYDEKEKALAALTGEREASAKASAKEARTAPLEAGGVARTIEKGAANIREFPEEVADMVVSAASQGVGGAKTIARGEDNIWEGTRVLTGQVVDWLLGKKDSGATYTKEFKDAAKAKWAALDPQVRDAIVSLHAWGKKNDIPIGKVMQLRNWIEKQGRDVSSEELAAKMQALEGGGKK